MATKKGIYFADDQAEFLGDITSKRVAMAVDRYREILRRERIDRLFTEQEWDLLRDVCNGTLFEPAQLIAGALAAEVKDATYDGIADKWSVDVPMLLENLEKLTYAQQVAVVESIEAWWRLQSDEG